MKIIGLTSRLLFSDKYFFMFCPGFVMSSLIVYKIPRSNGYSGAKVVTIPTQSTPPIPLQRSPRFRWKGRHLFRSKVRHFTPDLILLTD